MLSGRGCRRVTGTSGEKGDFFGETIGSSSSWVPTRSKGSTDRGSLHRRPVRYIQDRRFSRAAWFLCGARLPVKRRTEEDVIPKWLQKRFGLMNQELALPNGTTITYRQLRIPCCAQCNNAHLSKIERAVRLAFDQGPEAVAALDESILFLWLARGEDLDFTRRELWVRRTWGSRNKALGDRRINAPKSNRSRRVDMSQQLCRVRQGHLSVRAAEAVVAGRESSAWVFPDPGTPDRSLWLCVAPLLTRARVRTGPALRHTFAS